MAFTLTVTGAGLLMAAISQHDLSVMPWVVFSALLALAMLYRYLKFYRQYCYQLLLTYAELGELKSGALALGAAI